jgi:hypothetical protein
MPCSRSYDVKIDPSALCPLFSSNFLHELGYVHHSLESVQRDGENTRLLCCLFGAESVMETCLTSSSGWCDADVFLTNLDRFGPPQSMSTVWDEDAHGNGAKNFRKGAFVERIFMSADSQGGQHVRLDLQAVINFPRCDEEIGLGLGHEDAPMCPQFESIALSSWYLLTFLLPEAVFVDRFELARRGDLSDPAEAERGGDFEVRLLHAVYADSEHMVIGHRQCDEECATPAPLTRAVVLIARARGEAQHGATSDGSAFSADLRVSLPAHIRYHAAEHSGLETATKDVGVREVRLPHPLVHHCYFGGQGQRGVTCRLLASPASQVVSLRVPIGDLAYLSTISTITELVVLSTLALVLRALLYSAR